MGLDPWTTWLLEHRVGGANKTYEAFQYNSQHSTNDDGQIIRFNEKLSFALLYCSPVHNMN